VSKILTQPGDRQECISTGIGEQLYKNFQEFAKHIDTFYPETWGGYAIVKEPCPLYLDKNGYYKPFRLINSFSNEGGGLEPFSRIMGTFTLFFLQN